MVRDALGRPIHVGDIVVLDAPSAPWRVQEIRKVAQSPTNGMIDPRRPQELEVTVSASLNIRTLDNIPIREVVRAALSAEVKDDPSAPPVIEPDDVPSGPKLVQPS